MQSLLSYSIIALVCLRAHIYRLRILYSIFVVTTILFGSAWFFVWSAPAHFPEDKAIVVAAGGSLRDVADTFKEEQVIRSSEAFIVLVRLLSDEHSIQAGTYIFSKPYSLSSIVYRITHGVSDITLTQVTFVEGSTVRDMAEILATKFTDFPSDRFIEEALPYEGYLFPDTYRFMPNSTPEDIIGVLRKNFTEKTQSASTTIQKSVHSFSDIVIMASLLEREARTMEEKQMVAGILWKRISLGMPLQVDAVFGYIKGRDTYSPSFADLQIDSAYNTYRNKGLPPGPISNPGLESLLAAATPKETAYLYYLTGTDGKMHYATTFEEHKKNRAQYLGK